MEPRLSGKLVGSVEGEPSEPFSGALFHTLSCGNWGLVDKQS